LRGGADDVGLDHDIGRTADHQKMLDIVPADEDQPPPAIDRGCINDGEAGLASARICPSQPF
jgi:hypothetical protein